MVPKLTLLFTARGLSVQPSLKKSFVTTFPSHSKLFLIILGKLPNGLYWQPDTDVVNEGNFVNDPDVPNDRDQVGLDWFNDFAINVSNNTVIVGK